jgi:hypothetical protein
MDRDDALQVIRASVQQMTDEQLEAFAAIVYEEIHDNQPAAR